LICEESENDTFRFPWSKKATNGLLGTLSKVEREIFLKDFGKAFLLFIDERQLCAQCPGTRQDCTNLAMARPCPESLGVDVFGTVRKYELPIRVLKDYDEQMDRYAFLLID
jgi:predicted metal-binding protein